MPRKKEVVDLATTCQSKNGYKVTRLTDARMKKANQTFFNIKKELKSGYSYSRISKEQKQAIYDSIKEQSKMKNAHGFKKKEQHAELQLFEDYAQSL